MGLVPERGVDLVHLELPVEEPAGPDAPRQLARLRAVPLDPQEVYGALQEEREADQLEPEGAEQTFPERLFPPCLFRARTKLAGFALQPNHGGFMKERQALGRSPGG